MSSFYNMEGKLDPFAFACASNMPNLSHFDDLRGFSCNNTAQFFNDYTRRKEYGFSTHNYPSPPPTESKCSVPVPLPESTSMVFYSDEYSRDRPDSSMTDLSWYPSPRTPISPPPTLPTISQELPPSNDDGQEFYPVTSHADLKVSTSFSRTPDHSGSQSDLLSPLSPDWSSGYIADIHSGSPDESVLLRELPLDVDDDSSMREEAEERKKNDESCSKNGGLWTPRTSPAYLKGCHSFSSPSPQSALPVYSELPALDQVPPYPISPYAQSHYLTPIDDVLLHSPATPSRRSFKTLPEPNFAQRFAYADFDDESDMEPDTLMYPASPSSPTLTLPGADFEDDEFSFGLSSNFDSPEAYHSFTSSSSSSSSSSRSSSLLLDDPDVPTPRSPSPDNFDFDSSLLSLSGCSDPDIQNLIELRRRSMEAEQVAKSLERTMFDEGWIYKSHEARRTRKRAKERCKELSAMLRLRLGEKGVTMPSIEDEDVRSVKKRDGVTPSPVKKEKEVSIVRDMKQLVARMLLRRKELGTVKTMGRSMESKTMTPSPLRRSWVYGHDDDDDDDKTREEKGKIWSRDAEMEDLEDDIEMETGLNLSAFSEPPCTNGVEYRDPPWTMVVDV